MTAAHMRHDAPASRSCLRRRSACELRSTLRCQLLGAAPTARPGRCWGFMFDAAKALRLSPLRRAPRQLLQPQQRKLRGKHGRRPHVAASRLRRHPPRACGATPAFSGPRRSNGTAAQRTLLRAESMACSAMRCRYADWLQRTLAGWSGGPVPVVLLCSDDPGAALPALQPFGACTLVRFLVSHAAPVTRSNTASHVQAELAGADAYSALVEACGGGDDGAALADWFALCRCDALAVSNSTFSFSAAMLAAHAAPGGATSFLAARPDPHARALTAFDPWSAPSTLKLAT